MSPQTVVIIFSGVVILIGAMMASAIMGYRHGRARRGVPHLVAIVPAQRRLGRARRSRGTGVALGVGAVAVFGSIAFDMLGRGSGGRVAVPQPRSAAVSPMPGQIIEGVVDHVRDGDTIEIRGLALRLESLDCAEMDTAAGVRAAQAVKALTQGTTLLCRLTGARTYDRWVATCTLPDGRTVSQAMIEGGQCTRF